jgi:hypothetical protein
MMSQSGQSGQSIMDAIKDRVEEARQRAEKAREVRAKADTELSAAEADLSAWENALGAESRRQGIPAPTPTTAKAYEPPSELRKVREGAFEPAPEPNEIGNKAAMVRQYLRHHPGSAPVEIFKGLEGKVGKMYLHSLLSRMKKRGVLVEEKGRYSLNTKTAS